MQIRTHVIYLQTWALLFMILLSCKKPAAENSPVTNTPTSIADTAYRATKLITFDSVSVNIVIDKPAQHEVDVLIVFHGTVVFDSKILEAANNTLNVFKGILNRSDMMIVSVAYPEENLLMGDYLPHCEAALLWIKNHANRELGIKVKKIFLAGHSQGGYLVTRLNTLHETNGVIANAPGPLNLVYRCQLEEEGKIQKSATCTQLKTIYGTTTANPDAYYKRSLLNFTNGFKSDILFVQGMNDAAIQIYSWPTFKNTVSNCTDCKQKDFLELTGLGHGALFESEEAKSAFNQFINSR